MQNQCENLSNVIAFHTGFVGMSVTRKECKVVGNQTPVRTSFNSLLVLL